MSKIHARWGEASASSRLIHSRGPNHIARPTKKRLWKGGGGGSCSVDIVDQESCAFLARWCWGQSTGSERGRHLEAATLANVQTLRAVPAYRVALGILEQGEDFAGLAANSAASWRFCRRSDLYRQHRRVSDLGRVNRVEAIETGPQAGPVGAELTDLDPVAFRNIGG